jgi:hypothetical protein
LKVVVLARETVVDLERMELLSCFPEHYLALHQQRVALSVVVVAVVIFVAAAMVLQLVVVVVAAAVAVDAHPLAVAVVA